MNHKTHLSTRLLAVIAGVVLALAVIGVVFAATIVIDYFDFGDHYASCQTAAPCSAVSVLADSNIFGGERDIFIQKTVGASGPSRASTAEVATIDSTFNFVNGTGVEGYADVVWDGVDGSATVISTTGLGGVDLTGSGTNTGLRVRVLYDDNPVTVSLKIYTGTNASQYDIKIPGNIPIGSSVDFFAPFSQFTTISGTGFVSNSVGAVEMLVDARGTASSGADVTLELVQADATLDFGDLPQDATHTYSTTLAANGPRHLTGTGLRLGVNVDSEADGVPSTAGSANTDDNNVTVDDEDGVVRTPSVKWSVASGGSVDIVVNNGNSTGLCNASFPCVIHGWIDFNNNGNFGDPGEKVYTNTTYTGGSLAATTFSIPAGTTFANDFYARFRVCGGVGGNGNDCNTPQGYSGVGEVEDYLWGFGPTAVTLDSASATSEASMTMPIILITMGVISAVGVIILRRKRLHT